MTNGESVASTAVNNDDTFVVAREAVWALKGSREHS